MWQRNEAIPQHDEIHSELFSVYSVCIRQYIETPVACVCNSCFGFIHSNAFASATIDSRSFSNSTNTNKTLVLVFSSSDFILFRIFLCLLCAVVFFMLLWIRSLEIDVFFHWFCDFRTKTKRNCVFFHFHEFDDIGAHLNRLHGKMACTNCEWFSKMTTQPAHRNANSSQLCSIRMCIHRAPFACHCSMKRKIGVQRSPSNRFCLVSKICWTNQTSRTQLRPKPTPFTVKTD